MLEIPRNNTIDDEILTLEMTRYWGCRRPLVVMTTITAEDDEA